MLEQIFIKNFVLIRQLEISIPAGFIAITGETGAGKSIILDALAILLGERAPTSLIYPGEEKAEVCASFNISELPNAAHWLDEHGYSIDECQIKRVLSASGNSKAYLNGSPTSLQALKEFGEILVNIHRQHAHQDLLVASKHIGLFDKFIGADGLAVQVSQAFIKWRDLLKQQQSASVELARSQQQLSFLQTQLDEMQQLDLADGEIESLEQELKRLEQSEHILQSTHKALAMCAGDEVGSASGVEQQLNYVLQQLSNIDDAHQDLTEALEYLHNVQLNLQEAIASLNTYQSRVVYDPERQQQVQQRLDAIYQLSRKYNLQPQEILSTADKLDSEIEKLSINVSDSKLLDSQVASSFANYMELSQRLSNVRNQHQNSLDSKVNSYLAHLGMADCQLLTRLDSSEDIHTSCGIDKLEILVSTNDSKRYQSLKEIASGGELSRISLAIQVALAEKSSLPCLLFDEVDSGIGGNTCAVVGELLRKLGNNTQVICVTHQAQVAAYAHAHFLAEKQNSISQLSCLDKQARTREIMRMLSGNQSQSSQIHAQELLVQGQV